MVCPSATPEAGAHVAGDTKSEHFEPARAGSESFNEKQFSNNWAAVVGCNGRQLHSIFANWLCQLPTFPLPFLRVTLK
jgi:hypothetical protein